MEKGVVLKNFQDGSMTIDTLHLKAEVTLYIFKKPDELPNFCKGLFLYQSLIKVIIDIDTPIQSKSS